MVLSTKQKERYQRNILIHNFREDGQEKLLASSVLVIGAGGLGSPAILYLAAAGVGVIGIADFDEVSISNLQRQVLYQEMDIGSLKANCARDKIAAFNPDVTIKTHIEKVGSVNILDLIRNYDFILDCSDNAQTKFMINDACVLLHKSFAHCGVHEMGGQIMTYTPGHACLRCVAEVPRPGEYLSSKDVGILGATAGVFGALQAGETVKYLTGCGELLTDTWLVFDMKHITIEKHRVKRDSKCPLCGKNPTIQEVKPLW